MKIFIICHCAATINRCSRIIDQSLIDLDQNIKVIPTYTKVENELKPKREVNHYGNIMQYKKIDKLNKKIR